MIVFFQGILIGIANIIPGLSGGTMAVILGVYSRIIDSINSIISLNIKRFKFNFIFLTCLGVGAVSGIFLFATIIDFLLIHFYEPLFYFFMGTVVASIPVVYKLHSDMQVSIIRILFLIICFLIPVVFMFFNPIETTGQLAMTFGDYCLLGFSGFIAAVAMILPGISGSFMLLLLGSYSTIVTAIKSFQLDILFVVGVGVFSGILLCSKCVHWCLKKQPPYYID